MFRETAKSNSNVHGRWIRKGSKAGNRYVRLNPETKDVIDLPSHIESPGRPARLMEDRNASTGITGGLDSTWDWKLARE